MYTEQKQCRICEGELNVVLDLGSIYPTAWLAEDEAPPESAPLTLARCVTCGLVQLAHSVEQDELYRHYHYRSGINASMVEALRDVVARARMYVDLQPNDVVVDIGANDCTLLGFYPSDVLTVAYEPSNIVFDEGNFAPDVISNDYFSAAAYPTDLPGARIITSIAMFYDLPDPRQFVRDIKRVMAQDGVWVVQINDLKSMLETNAFDGICHEHLEYYRALDIVRLAEDEGLSVFCIEHNEVNGGSLRFYIDRGVRGREASVEKFLAEESEYYASGVGSITAFAARVEASRTLLLQWLEGYRAGGQVVYGIGASTKGNTLLQYFGIDSALVSAIGDLNREKFGRLTVGTRIPVISEADVLAQQPPYLLLLIWQYLPFFLEKLRPYMDAGGILVVPLPEPRFYFVSDSGEIESMAIEKETVDGH